MSLKICEIRVICGSICLFQTHVNIRQTDAPLFSGEKESRFTQIAFFFDVIQRACVIPDHHIYPPAFALVSAGLVPRCDRALLRFSIESFFNWLEEYTGIQVASKVRSLNGLLVHVFGRLTAAMFLFILNS